LAANKKKIDTINTKRDCYTQSSVVGRSVCPVLRLSAAQKRLSRSRCRLDGWLMWAQGNMYYMASRSDEFIRCRVG